MGLFANQFLNVIEWNETRDDILFWKWRNNEIKKGSRLIIKPGQDAIFLYNGKIEGIFTDEGNYEIETQIIPFLSTLKGFKFGFNSGLRAEVLFINTKDFLVKWGTKNAVNIPSQRMPGGIPVRAFGTFSVRIQDHVTLIDKVAGIKQEFAVDDVRDRVLSVLDQLLMKWISREGKDLFNLQANAFDIAKGIRQDLDDELLKIGLSITDLTISSFNYPEQIQKMIEKNAANEMVGDIGRYQQMSMADSLQNPGSATAAAVQSGAAMAMGMNMMNQMAGIQAGKPAASQAGTVPCAACGKSVSETAKFCGNCGTQVVRQTAQSAGASKFCPDCGAAVADGARFCGGCGNKI